MSTWMMLSCCLELTRHFFIVPTMWELEWRGVPMTCRRAAIGVGGVVIKRTKVGGVSPKPVLS